jgi:hypothetical protein
MNDDRIDELWLHLQIGCAYDSFDQNECRGNADLCRAALSQYSLTYNRSSVSSIHRNISSEQPRVHVCMHNRLPPPCPRTQTIT